MNTSQWIFKACPVVSRICINIRGMTAAKFRVRERVRGQTRVQREAAKNSHLTPSELTLVNKGQGLSIRGCNMLGSMLF